MTHEFEQLLTESTDLLHSLCTDHGILASTLQADNYKRIWARDSVVCGLAGILLKDPVIIEGLKKSLLTLAKNQHPLGKIPSNINLEKEGDISFGNLVGRVDSSIWFVLGSCLYYLHTHDSATWKKLQLPLKGARNFLKTIEFNAKGWIYTPLSGNWADEYPVHGYTLYDNMLRLWANSLWEKITGSASSELEQLNRRTKGNFWPASSVPDELRYQNKPFNEALQKDLSHFIAFILPGKYDTRFDAAGNALALLNFTISNEQKDKVSGFLDQLKSEIGTMLIPAFWPVIDDSSPDLALLRGNYSYEFKNHAGAFHNGGIWPVWMGLFCLGLAKQGMHKEVEAIIESFTKLIGDSGIWKFQEYIHSNTKKLEGKSQMGFSASGVVFMDAALNQKFL